MSTNRIENVTATRPGANPPAACATAKVFALFLCCLVPLVAFSCATRKVTVKPDDPLYGTWINTDVDTGKERGFAKTVLFPEGRELDYHHIADTVPALEATFTIEEAWIDRRGYHWYKIKALFWTYDTDGAKTGMFGLTKINPDGTVIESAGQQSGYPDKVEPVMSPNYGIGYRQK